MTIPANLSGSSLRKQQVGALKRGLTRDVVGRVGTIPGDVMMLSYSFSLRVPKGVARDEPHRRLLTWEQGVCLLSPLCGHACNLMASSGVFSWNDTYLSQVVVATVSHFRHCRTLDTVAVWTFFENESFLPQV